MHPNALFIKRPGEVNAWDNPEFRAAVKATGKKQVIIAGITTDVRPSSPSLLPSTNNAIGVHGVPRAVAPRGGIHRLRKQRRVRHV